MIQEASQNTGNKARCNSRAHTQEVNGYIKSYFSIFEDNYIYTREIFSFEYFRKNIEWAVFNWNRKRPHSSLNYMTSAELDLQY